MAEVAAEKLIDLTLFCDPNAEGCRYALDKPWIKSERFYATDGRIAIRLFLTSRAANDTFSNPGARVPNVDEVLERMPSSDWIDLPPVPKCPTCGGRTLDLVLCRECIGGSAECPHCGQEMKCDGCGGAGETIRKCDDCPRLSIFGKLIANIYWRKMASLPGIQVCAADDKPEDALFFRFDGGDGAVMPVKE